MSELKSKEILDSYNIEFCKFNSDFIPATGKCLYPTEPGFYRVIRCGFSGIYQMLDEYRDGKWSTEILDGSFVIAYSREKVKIEI